MSNHSLGEKYKVENRSFYLKKDINKNFYKLKGQLSNGKIAIYNIIVDKIKEPIFIKYVKENRIANLESFGKVVYCYFEDAR